MSDTQKLAESEGETKPDAPTNITLTFITLCKLYWKKYHNHFLCDFCLINLGLNNLPPLWLLMSIAFLITEN